MSVPVGGCRGVGVAGWNASAACSDGSRVLVGDGLGTLLGPEKTPCLCVFLVPLPVRVSNAWVCLCGGVGVDVGCGCVLSVA